MKKSVGHVAGVVASHARDSVKTTGLPWRHQMQGAKPHALIRSSRVTTDAPR